MRTQPAPSAAWRLAVIRSAMGYQFCCGECDRVTDPQPLEVTITLAAGHLLRHIDPGS